jgi:hypothetical protein
VTRGNIGGADGGRTHDLRIAKPDKRSSQVLVIPLLTEQDLLLRRADTCEEVLADAENVLLTPCVQLVRRGRQEAAYGRPARCTTCRRPPRYRDGLLVDCECGAAANPHAPPTLVRFVEDGQ